MKTQCPKCKTMLKTEDSKIPKRGAFGRCPKCSERIFIKGGVQEVKEIDDDAQYTNNVAIRKDCNSQTAQSKKINSIIRSENRASALNNSETPDNDHKGQAQGNRHGLNMEGNPFSFNYGDDIDVGNRIVELENIYIGELPKKVRSAYKPSGKIEGKYSILFLGIVFIVVSLPIVYFTGKIGLLTFFTHKDSQSTLWKIGALGGALFYTLGPFLIPALTAFGLAMGIGTAKCRSIIFAFINALILSAIEIFCFYTWLHLYTVPGLTGEPLTLDDRIMYTTIFASIVIPSMLFFARWVVVRGAFCEECNEYMDEQSLGVFPASSAKPLILDLYGIDSTGTGEKEIPELAADGILIADLHTCPKCKKTLFEIKSEDKYNIQTRLFSGWSNKNKLTAIRRLLSVYEPEED